MTDAMTYRVMQLVSVKTTMAAVCTLLEDLADQMNDVIGMDEEREEVRAILAKGDRLYKGLCGRIKEEEE